MTGIQDSDLSVAGRVRQFDKRQGGGAEMLGVYWYYANGACREVDPLGAMMEPPVNEYARLSNVIQYHRARLAQAVRAFDELRESLIANPYEDPEALSELKRRQALVSERNAELEEVKAQRDRTDEGQFRINRQLMQAESAAKTSSFQQAVRGVRI